MSKSRAYEFVQIAEQIGPEKGPLLRTLSVKALLEVAASDEEVRPEVERQVAAGAPISA